MTPEELIKNSEEIGSPPDIIHRMQMVINSKRSSAADIGKVIQTDGPLAARLLKVANSSLYNVEEPVESIPRAVTMIGTSQIQSLAMAASIIDKFQGICVDFFNTSDFWRHSLAVACTARALAMLAGETNAEQSFLGGVLHDLGRLCMLATASQEMIEAIKQAHIQRKPLFEAEQEQFGWTHCDAAAALMKTWNLPPDLMTTVIGHHDPQRDRGAAILHAADAMVHGLAIGASGEHMVPRVDNRVWELLAMEPIKIQKVIPYIERTYPGIESMLLGTKQAAA